MDEYVSSRVMNLVFLLDTSGTMNGERINQLNSAMPEVIKAAKEAAMSREVELRMRVIEFNTYAHWLYGDQESGVPDIVWQDLTAGGGTNTSAAIDLATSIMHTKYLGIESFMPFVILVTDGLSNSPEETAAAAKRLKESLVSRTNPNADKIVRIAIGVKNANRAELEGFASLGTIINEDGDCKGNVPLVFNIAANDSITKLKDILKAVVVGGSISITHDRDNDNGVVISVPTTESDDDWPLDD